MRGLGLFLGFGRATKITAPVVLTPGPELWPQPVYAASTGLTLLRSSIAGGLWVSDASGLPARCTMTTPPVMSAGQQYQWSITVTQNTSDIVAITIDGKATDACNGQVGTFSGIAVATSSTAQIRFDISDNFQAVKVSATSVKLLS